MSNVSTQHEAVLLTVHMDHNVQRDYALRAGETLMIGSGANCAIKLDDPQVASIHCLLRFDEGKILVQDWCTSLGTLVDGTRIEEETPTRIGSSIQIGRFRVEVKPPKQGQIADHLETEDGLPEPSHTEASEGEIEPEGHATLGLLDEFVAESCRDDAVEPDSTPWSSLEKAPEPSPVESGSPVASSESSSPQASYGSTTRPASAPTKRSSDEITQAWALANSPIDPETVQLLEAEIECLQVELAERDRQIEELSARRDATPDLDESVENASSEIERLMLRLEQLLEELARSDQRVAALEELLRAEQEVTQAQDEERQQMETWLREIEARIAAREEEWQAEKEVLAARLEQVKNERDEADRQFQSLQQDPGMAAERAPIVAELRGQNDQLRDELSQASKEKAALRKELESLRVTDAEELIQQRVDEAMRSERLAISQERAEMSRLRAELAQQASQIREPSQTPKANDADERYLALRDTLKELHQQDRSSVGGPKKAGLATRLADLWRRLDGPTDTD